jgi:hypothetical protein
MMHLDCRLREGDVKSRHSTNIIIIIISTPPAAAEHFQHLASNNLIMYTSIKKKGLGQPKIGAA